MAHDGHALGVHLFVCHEIVHRAAQPPSPRCDGSPFVWSRLGLAGLQEKRAHSHAHTAKEIWLDIAVINSRDPIPVRSPFFPLPLFRVAASIRAGEAFCLSLAIPN